MSDNRPPGGVQAYWRCGDCGTPNPGASYVTHCVACGRPRAAPARAAKPAAPVGSPTRVAIRPTRGRFGGWASWAYAALVLVVLGLIRWVGDGWWGTTVLLFLPRWLFLLPLPVLALVSARTRSFRHWVVQGATALVVAGPLMGLSLPFARFLDDLPEGERVRLATINLGTGRFDTARLRRWLDAEKVDVVCLQEVHATDGPTRGRILDDGWEVNRAGTIASRLPVVSELETLSDESTTEGRYTARLDRSRLRTASGREFVVASAHLPTLRRGLTGRSVEALRTHVAWWGHETGRVLGLLAQTYDVPLLVGGDFNMPSDDSTMAALRSSFRFAFEEAGWGYGYTAPAPYAWVRIDHVLAGPEWYVTACRVGPGLGSDHRPLLAEVLLPRGRTAPAAAKGAPAPGPSH